MKAIKNIRPDYVVRATAMIAVGIVLAIWTTASIDFMARIIAIILVAIGGTCVINYVIHKERNFERSGAFLAGAVIAAFGIWVFVNPGRFTDVIPKIFGLFILVSGLENIGQTISLIRYKARTWIVSLIIAFITCGIGAFLLFRPSDAKEIAVTLIGVFLIIDGVTNLITSLLIGIAAKRVDQERNAVDTEAVIVEEEKK